MSGSGCGAAASTPSGSSPDLRDERLRAEIAPDGEVIVGYVGRLAIEKRVDLLAAVAALPGVKLAVTGGGPMEEELRAALPSAAFLGMRYGADLARIYASLDVFVHTGPFETFGQTIQEASASGLPVVAPASGGPLDLVDDGATGYLVAAGRPGRARRRRCASWPATRRCAPGSARRRGGACSAAPGPRSPTSCSAHYAAVIDADALPARLAA